MHNKTQKQVAEVFGANIRKAMQDRGWNDSKLAAKSGLSPRAVAYYKSGGRVPSIEKVQALGRALGVEAVQLLIDPDNSLYLSQNRDRADLHDKIDRLTDEQASAVRVMLAALSPETPQKP